MKEVAKEAETAAAMAEAGMVMAMAEEVMVEVVMAEAGMVEAEMAEVMTVRRVERIVL